MPNFKLSAGGGDGGGHVPESDQYGDGESGEKERNERRSGFTAGRSLCVAGNSSVLGGSARSVGVTPDNGHAAPQTAPKRPNTSPSWAAYDTQPLYTHSGSLFLLQLNGAFTVAKQVLITDRFVD